jgi:predicted extracellular nuclease
MVASGPIGSALSQVAQGEQAMQLGNGLTPRVATVGSAAAPPPRLTVATFNAWNFFDTVDDPRTRDSIYQPEQYHARLVKLAGTVARTLGAPDVLTLQEIENTTVLDDLLRMPQLAGLGYQYVLSSKADTRGIRNAILYRGDRLVLRSLEEPNPVSTLPPEDPQLIGSDRLFARSPMVATFGLVGPADAKHAAFTIINNHFKSKLGGEFYEPRRRAQGAFIGGLVDALRGAEPNLPVIVAGDLNATLDDGAYKQLVRWGDGSSRMHEPLLSLPDEDRYTYVYRGTKNLLDHLLVTPDLADAVESVRILHVNTGKADHAKRFNPRTTHGTSDHDPIMAVLRLPVQSKR